MPRILEVVRTWMYDKKNQLMSTEVTTDVNGLENILIGHSKEVNLTESVDGIRVPLVIVINNDKGYVGMPLADITDLAVTTIVPDSIYVGISRRVDNINTKYQSLRGGQIFEVFRHKGLDTRQYVSDKRVFVRIDHTPYSNRRRNIYAGRVPSTCPDSLSPQVILHNTEILRLIAANPQFIRYLKPQTDAGTPLQANLSLARILPVYPAATKTQPIAPRELEPTSDDGNANPPPNADPPACPNANPHPEPKDLGSRVSEILTVPDETTAPKKETKEYTCALYYDQADATHAVIVGQSEKQVRQLARKIADYLFTCSGSSVEIKYPKNITVILEGLTAKYIKFEGIGTSYVPNLDVSAFEATKQVDGLKLKPAPCVLKANRKTDSRLTIAVEECIRDYIRK